VRYGISDKLDNIQDGDKNQLSSAEASTFKAALEHLKKEPAAGSAVVFDILKREESEPKYSEPKYKDFHSVVLYKDKNNKLVLIDPSNPQFSNWIVKTPQIIDNDVSVSEGTKGFCIYNSKHEKKRDCIDIAMKLCLTLETFKPSIKEQTNEENQEYSKKEFFTNKNLAIKMVSNNKLVYPKDFFKGQQPLIRLKQSSDIKIMKKMNEVLDKLVKLDSYAVAFGMKDLNISNIFENDDPEEIIKKYKDLHEFVKTQITKAMSDIE
jgi:hypothetical protein